MVKANFALIAVVLVAAVFIISYSGAGAISYQRNADTLTTTGTMNIGTPKNLYLANTDMTDVPVDGSVFANASGYLHVEVTPSTKYCTYQLYKQTGFASNSIFDTYYASALTNDLKYNVKITQPDGTVTQKNALSPFDMSNVQVQLPANPDRPNKAVYVQFNGQQAALGQTSCDDRNNFVVLSFLGNNYALKKADYEAQVRDINVANVYDFFTGLVNQNSFWRYDKPLDLSNTQNLVVKYYEPSLGDAQVSVSAPFWAYNTIIFEKTPEGRASDAMCVVTKASAGQQTYANLIYTNTGDTSKFFYTFSGSDYTITSGSNSGSQVPSGTQHQDYFTVSAVTAKSQATLNVLIRGESGIETPVVCIGEITSGGTSPPPPPPPPNPNVTSQKCIPIIQHPVVQEVGGNYLDLVFTRIYLGGTSQVQTCETDYMGLIILGAVGVGVLMVLGRKRR